MGLKTNRWYPMSVTPKNGTYGIIGETDMGYLFELCYDKDGVWKESYVENHKVYYKPLDKDNGFYRWKKVR